MGEGLFSALARAAKGSLMSLNRGYPSGVWHLAAGTLTGQERSLDAIREIPFTLTANLLNNLLVVIVINIVLAANHYLFDQNKME